MSTTHTIPSYKLGDLTSKIDWLNRKADKLGLPRIELTILGEELVKCRLWDNAGILHRDIAYMATTIEISGESPKINGWQFIAKLEHTQSGNVIYSMSDVDLPLIYRNRKSYCDHCNIDRQRNNTYILYRQETGEYKQVGSSCLKDFTGLPNAEDIAEMLAFIPGLTAKSEEPEDDLYSFKTGKRIINLKNYLACVIAAIRCEGWTGSKGDGYATKLRALDIYFDMQLTDHKIEVIENDVKQSEEVLPYVKNVLNGKNTLSDYEYNISVLIENEYITLPQLGYAASIIPLWQRMEEEENKVKAIKEESKSTYTGTIGDKLEGLKVTVLSQNTLDSMYGLTYLYNFLTSEGNKLTWFASKDQGLDNGQSCFIAKCTVKDHKEYRGEQQTIITRAKIS